MLKAVLAEDGKGLSRQFIFHNLSFSVRSGEVINAFKHFKLSVAFAGVTRWSWAIEKFTSKEDLTTEDSYTNDSRAECTLSCTSKPGLVEPTYTSIHFTRKSICYISSFGPKKTMWRVQWASYAYYLVCTAKDMNAYSHRKGMLLLNSDDTSCTKPGVIRICSSCSWRSQICSSCS